MELYIKNVAYRWRKEMGCAIDKAYILSPYITSSTADTVLARVDGSVCVPEIYTTFSAELFASKASSLRTLKKMLEHGCSLYHLPNLHAKVVLIPGVFASIGSQNLTRAGTRNKEASIALLDPKIIQRLEEELRPWFEERLPITTEMIADMERLLGTVEELFDTAKIAAQSLDKQVLQLQFLREEAAKAEESARREKERQLKLEAEQRRLAEVAKKRRYQRFDDYRNKAKVAKNFAYGAIRHLNNIWLGGEGTRSLLADVNFDLTSWLTIDGKAVFLERGKRYLTIEEGSGRLGWSRVMKTRISFIGRNVNFNYPIQFEGSNVYISASGDWSDCPKNGRNTFLTVKNASDQVVCEVSGWFDLNSIELLDISPLDKSASSVSEQNYYSSLIRDNFDSFRDIWVKQITTPFNYLSDRVGVNAVQFFGQEGEHFKINLAFSGNNPILLVKRIGY